MLMVSSSDVGFSSAILDMIYIAISQTTFSRSALKLNYCIDYKYAQFENISFTKIPFQIKKNVLKNSILTVEHGAPLTDDTIYLDDDQADQKCGRNLKDVSWHTFSCFTFVIHRVGR